MRNKVVSLADRRNRNRYYYSMGYVYLIELLRFLTGALLVSAAPFFYGVVTNDFLGFAVFEACATVGAMAGALNFLAHSFERRQPPAPADRVPRIPSVARRGWKVA